jgi:carboxy-cis,cis-muconate cyclase
VTAFSLDSVSGAVKEQLSLLPTTGSGGTANSVSPALFNENYFAITDSQDSFVEVWKLETIAARNKNRATQSAKVVAHLDLYGGPANVVWYR